MAKYKIVQNCGYTHLYKDGEEIKGLQSLEFSRKSVDEVATLTVKMICPEAEIEIEDEGCKINIDKIASKGDNLDN